MKFESTAFSYVVYCTYKQTESMAIKRKLFLFTVWVISMCTYVSLLSCLGTSLPWCYSSLCNEWYLWRKRHNYKLAIFSLSSTMKFPLLILKDFLNMIILCFWHLNFCVTFFNEYATFLLKSQERLGGFCPKCQSEFNDNYSVLHYKCVILY